MSGAEAALARAEALHIPVLLNEVVAALAPAPGKLILDGAFGAGGYARALLARGAAVIGLDRDPDAIERGRGWAGLYEDRLTLVEARFSTLDAHTPEALDGVVLDIGVSSMQIDDAERGFSFLRDGPLDMRMAQSGRSAADLVNDAPEAELAAILRVYGEERAARRIARAIIEAREDAPVTTTAQLAAIVASRLPHPRPGQPHPATRSFQALRIAVNDELGELVAALSAAERALKPGGVLAVVTFHSLEDRIVKRFFQLRSDRAPAGSRHAPETRREPARFDAPAKPVEPSDAETAANPRARSARLRWGRRLDAPAGAIDPKVLGLPVPEARR